MLDDIDDTLDTRIIIAAIEKAFKIEKHRRSVYQPPIYRVRQRKWHSSEHRWDNACIESFHTLIKREWLNRVKIRDDQQAYHLIFKHIEAFYNTKHIHSYYDSMSPNDFENLYEQTQTNALLLAS